MANDLEFDDTEAIRFILNALPEESKARVSDDDVQYVLDLICEYYDENNYYDESNNAETAIVEDEMFDSIWHKVQKEKIVNLTEDDLRAILDGEYEYGVKIGVYTES